MDIEFITSNWYLFLALAIIVALLYFDGTQQNISGIKKISAIQLPQLISHESAVVVDICAVDEYENGHIQKAINLPLNQFEDKINRIKKYRNKPIVLACQKGQHCSRAASILKKHEFTNIYTLDGGMFSWRKENLPLVKNKINL